MNPRILVGNVAVWAVVPDHRDDCPMCRGKRRVQIHVVRSRVAGGPCVADPVGALVVCPFLHPLAQLLGDIGVSRPSGGDAA